MTRTRLARHALRIFRAALKAADPERAVREHFHFDGEIIRVGRERLHASAFDRIQVIGAGKASAAMALALETILGRRISGGLVNVPDGPLPKLRRIELHPSGHPIPDRRGEQGARRMLAIAEAAGARDLLICLISGGASALMPVPSPGITLQRKRGITRSLLRAGASIHEMNAVRKHLSRIKGGQLARAAFPAIMLTLILSDVVGDDPSVIGSGPTIADPSTREDAIRILKKYRVALPAAALVDTPKPGDPRLARAHYEIVGSNRQAIRAAREVAKRLGYRTLVLSTTIQGETKDVAQVHAAIAREVLATAQPVKPPACLLSGGETTVTVRGTGLGGRNQEFVLAAALELQSAQAAGRGVKRMGNSAGLAAPGESFVREFLQRGGPVTILSAGTDGIDGPTDAAGAFADESTVPRAAALGLDARQFLENNDSYRFFKRMGTLIKTGPTGTNVMDIRLLLIG
ncbi:MAG TPA: glycerate kinase [Bryobacteraceae bacterium]